MRGKLIDMIKNSCALKENLTKQTKLKEISIDSLSFIALIVELENKYEIEFKDNELELELYETVGDLINLIEKKLAKTALT